MFTWDAHKLDTTPQKTNFIDWTNEHKHTHTYGQTDIQSRQPGLLWCLSLCVCMWISWMESCREDSLCCERHVSTCTVRERVSEWLFTATAGDPTHTQIKKRMNGKYHAGRVKFVVAGLAGKFWDWIVWDMEDGVTDRAALNDDDETKKKLGPATISKAGDQEC